MSNGASLTLLNDRIKVSGQLDFESVPAIWRESLNVFSSFTGLEIDLGEVTQSNSAGLALLMAWLRYAAKHQMRISFKNLPQKMSQMASAAGLTSLFEAG